MATETGLSVVRADSYEEALWLTVSGLGDRDTTCAMVGGIVALYTGVKGIPAPWMQAREPLPQWERHRMRLLATTSKDPPAGNEIPRRISQRSAVSSVRPTRFIQAET